MNKMNETRRTLLPTILFTIGALVFMAPILWMAISSFKNPIEVTAYPPTLLFEPTLDNYRELFGRTDFGHYTWNSFVVAGLSTLLGLVLAIPAAFAISWHRMTWPATVSLSSPEWRQAHCSSCRGSSCSRTSACREASRPLSSLTP